MILNKWVFVNLISEIFFIKTISFEGGDAHIVEDGLLVTAKALLIHWCHVNEPIKFGDHMLVTTNYNHQYKHNNFSWKFKSVTQNECSDQNKCQLDEWINELLPWSDEIIWSFILAPLFFLVEMVPWKSVFHWTIFINEFSGSTSVGFKFGRWGRTLWSLGVTWTSLRSVRALPGVGTRIWSIFILDLKFRFCDL